MIKGIIYYKTPKLGCCGLEREDIETPVECGDYEEFKDQALEVMEDFETGFTDSYKIEFLRNELPLFKVYNKEDKWYFERNGELINSTCKYSSLLE